jgi:hypothetical protein
MSMNMLRVPNNPLIPKRTRFHFPAPPALPAGSDRQKDGADLSTPSFFTFQQTFRPKISLPFHVSMAAALLQATSLFQ